jgi:hypothetical protein
VTYFHDVELSGISLVYTIGYIISCDLWYVGPEFKKCSSDGGRFYRLCLTLILKFTDTL